MRTEELLRTTDGSLGFIFVPVIGGGTPEASLLKAVYDECLAQGVTSERLSIWLTQHGDTEEIAHALAADGKSAGGKVTCGARKAALSEGRGLPEALRDLVCKLSPSMLGNGQLVKRSVVSALKECDISCAVELAYYDHEKKTIILVDDHGRRLDGETAINTGLELWRESFQDPSVVVVSYGPKAAATPHGVAFPETVGTLGNNDFSAACADDAGLLRVFAEIEYPLLHKAEHHNGHAHDNNFAHLSGLIVLVDDKAYADRLTSMLATRKCLLDILQASLGGFYLCRLSDGAVDYLSTTDL